MKATIPLAPDVSGRLAELGSIDLLVGIPSFNNARTIGHVVRAVTDGTPRIVAEASLASRETLLVAHPLTTVHRIAYHAASDIPPGEGHAR